MLNSWMPSRLQKPLARWLYSYDLLAFCYLAMFVPIFLSNRERIAHQLFVWVVIPAALLPFLTVRSATLGQPRALDLTVVFRGYIPRRLSLVFLGVCLYLVA